MFEEIERKNKLMIYFRILNFNLEKEEIQISFSLETWTFNYLYYVKKNIPSKFSFQYFLKIILSNKLNFILGIFTIKDYI